MAEVRISAQARTEFGKGGARRVRRAGNLPAVLYGHGAEPRHISLVTREFESALRTDGANVLLELQLEDGSELALPKSVQRDPVRGVIEHVDLILVRRGEQITVDVPVTVEGDVAPGGLVDQQVVSVSVVAEATHLPSSFTVSIDGLAIGSSIHAGDIDLPEGSAIAGDPEQVIVHILAAPTAEQMESEGAGEGVEGETAPTADVDTSQPTADDVAAGGDGDGDSETPAEA